MDEEQKKILLNVAVDSIRRGTTTGRSLRVNAKNYPSELQVERATFVTLHENGELRGCIGMLEACRPLVVDVAENAFAAAFEDPRFSPVTADEVDALEIHISILSPPEPMTIKDEADLLSQLRPGIDGLIIQDGFRKATFLPSVWEELSDPREFLHHLKRKAGFSPDHWSKSFRAFRYTAESVP
jgi:uncharacterized protein